nr:hypothetical protein [Desulfobacterales bacterium]
MLFAAALTTAAGAQERTIPQSSAFLQLKQAIERQYYTYDRDRILPLLNRAQALIRQDGANWYPYYYAGILHVQLGNIARADDKAAAHRYYTLAREHLEVAHRKSTSAETTLWMSAVYGKLASLRTFKMIYYGARSKAFMEDAYAMSRGNPKFFMRAGVHVMHTPA